MLADPFGTIIKAISKINADHAVVTPTLMRTAVEDRRGYGTASPRVLRFASSPRRFTTAPDGPHIPIAQVISLHLFLP